MSGWTLFFAVGLPIWLLFVIGFVVAIGLMKNASKLNDIMNRLDRILEDIEHEEPKIASNITKTTDEVSELVRSLKDTIDVLTMVIVAGKTNFRTILGLAMPLIKKGFDKSNIDIVKDYLGKKRKGGKVGE